MAKGFSSGNTLACLKDLPSVQEWCRHFSCRQICKKYWNIPTCLNRVVSQPLILRYVNLKLARHYDRSPSSLSPEYCLSFVSESEKNLLFLLLHGRFFLSSAALNSIKRCFVSSRGFGHSLVRGISHDFPGKLQKSGPRSLAAKFFLIHPLAHAPKNAACASGLPEQAIEPAARRVLPPSLTGTKSVVELYDSDEIPVGEFLMVGCKRFPLGQ